MKRRLRLLALSIATAVIALVAASMQPAMASGANCQYVFCAGGCYLGGCEGPCIQTCYSCPWGAGSATGCIYPE